MLKLLVNGRFLTRSMSGVDRAAGEIVRALAALSLSENTAPSFALNPSFALDPSFTLAPSFMLDIALPHGAPPDDEVRDRLGLTARSRIHRSRRSGYLWEQLVLSRLEPEATLLSLCNVGPVLRRRQAVMIHDTQVHDAPESYTASFRVTYKMLQPVLTRRADRIFAVSRHSRRQMQAHGLAAGRTIHVVHNGSDHIGRLRSDDGILSRLGLTSGEYLLALYHPARHKNIGTVIRAAARRQDRRFPLVLAGGGHSAIFGTEAMRADGSIRMVGRVRDEELKALYEHARMFLFPSLTEGFGLPVLEAMSCGCPVIAATGGAIPEVAGHAAILCSPADEAAWTSAIDALQGDPERRASLSASGRERASHFTWARSAQQILSALSYPEFAVNSDLLPRRSQVPVG